jgi:serine/threonine-protein kinase
MPPSSLPSELAATRFAAAFAASRAPSGASERPSARRQEHSPTAVSRETPSRVPPAGARDLAVAESVRRAQSRPSPSRGEREPDSDAGGRRALLRPFPSRFAGKFQVRGPVLRAVDRAIAEAHGQKARDEVVAQLAPRWANEFRNESLNALVSYDLEALDEYLEIASALTVRDVRTWRELGRRGVEGELAPFVRPALKAASDPTAAVRRGVTTWSKLFSFGSWRVAATTERRLALHLSEFDPASLPLRLWLVGVVEGTVRRALGKDIRVTITLGEMGFTPELACEIVVP